MKDGADHDLTCKQGIACAGRDAPDLRQDRHPEFRGLPNALNEMFYKDVFETAAKGGFWVCDAKLSILGCFDLRQS